MQFTYRIRMTHWSAGESSEPVTVMECGLFQNAMQWLLDKAAKYHVDAVQWIDPVGPVFLMLQTTLKDESDRLYALERIPC